MNEAELTRVAGVSLRILHRRELDDAIEVEAEFASSSAVCPRCEAVTGTVHDQRLQRKRDGIERNLPIWLLLWKRRFRCNACGTVFSEPDPISGSRRRITERFRAQLRQAAAVASPKQVASRFKVSLRQVQRVLREDAST